MNKKIQFHLNNRQIVENESYSQSSVFKYLTLIFLNVVFSVAIILIVYWLLPNTKYMIPDRAFVIDNEGKLNYDIIRERIYIENLLLLNSEIEEKYNKNRYFNVYDTSIYEKYKIFKGDILIKNKSFSIEEFKKINGLQQYYEFKNQVPKKNNTLPKYNTISKYRLLLKIITMDNDVIFYKINIGLGSDDKIFFLEYEEDFEKKNNFILQTKIKFISKDNFFKFYSNDVFLSYIGIKLSKIEIKEFKVIEIVTNNFGLNVLYKINSEYYYFNYLLKNNLIYINNIEKVEIGKK
jgi:hypothetical protein